MYADVLYRNQSIRSKGYVKDCLWQSSAVFEKRLALSDADRKANGKLSTISD